MSGSARNGPDAGSGPRVRNPGDQQGGLACPPVSRFSGAYTRIALRCTRIALRYTRQGCPGIAPGPIVPVASGRIMDHERRVRKPGRVAKSCTRSASGARPGAGAWRRSCPRSCVGRCPVVSAVAGAFVTGVALKAGTPFLNAMSARRAHWRARPSPGDGLHFGWRRGRRSRRRKAMADARQRDAETTSLALAKAGAATGAAGAPRRRGTCRSRTGPGMAAGRCGRAAAKPRDGRESVRNGALRMTALSRGGRRPGSSHPDRPLHAENGCRVSMRIGKAMTCSRRESRTAQPSTETMADARQRDAESTAPARAAASAAMNKEAERWPRKTRPRARRATRASPLLFPDLIRSGPASGEAGAVSGTGSLPYKKIADRVACPMSERRRDPRGWRPMPGQTGRQVFRAGAPGPPGSRRCRSRRRRR